MLAQKTQYNSFLNSWLLKIFLVICTSPQHLEQRQRHHCAKYLKDSESPCCKLELQKKKFICKQRYGKEGTGQPNQKTKNMLECDRKLDICIGLHPNSSYDIQHLFCNVCRTIQISKWLIPEGQRVHSSQFSVNHTFLINFLSRIIRSSECIFFLIMSVLFLKTPLKF